MANSGQNKHPMAWKPQLACKRNLMAYPWRLFPSISLRISQNLQRFTLKTLRVQTPQGLGERGVWKGYSGPARAELKTVCNEKDQKRLCHWEVNDWLFKEWERYFDFTWSSIFDKYGLCVSKRIENFLLLRIHKEWRFVFKSF